MLFYEELKQEPIFLGFAISKDPDGNLFDDKKKPIGVDRVPGVGADNLDSRLGTFDQASALNLPFLGLSLMRPVVVGEHHLVCIDLDWKRSPTLTPKPEQAALMDFLFSMDAAYEMSYSKHGCHFFVKIPLDLPIPKTVDLGEDCHIEVFCGNQSQRANILLTNYEASGELVEIDLMDAYQMLGIKAEATPDPLTQDSSNPITSDITVRSVTVDATEFDKQIAKASFTDRDMEDLRSAIASIPPAKDYNEWYTKIGLPLKSMKGVSGGAYDDQLFALWDEYSQRNTLKYSPKDTLAKWNQSESVIRSSLGTIFHNAKQAGWIRPRPVFTGEATEFSHDKKGVIENTQENLLLHLKQYQLCYDEFLATKMGVFDGVMRAIDDNDITRIQLDAERLGFRKLPTQFVRENVDFDCSRNSFDSAIDWGNSLVWDGTPRCHHLLVHYFGAQDSEYIQAASMYIASAMGGRLMEPGCKADAAIVLIGPQGIGKSTGISALSPMEDTFVEINLSTRDTDLSRQLRGKLIGEIAELRGLHSRESEDIKAFMSRTFENWVPKYKEYETTFKRRLTFWGTSNEREFLSDHTGNRRWLPVEITTPNADLVKQDRDQIWAEAIWIYRQYGILYEKVNTLAPAIQDEHVFQDPVRSSLEEWLVKKDPNLPITVKNYYASTMRAQSMEISVKESRAVGRAFTALGYTGRNQRVGNIIQRVYTKDE